MTSEQIVNITATNWADEVGKAEVPVLIEFGAAWCAPCRMLAPILAELAGEYNGTVKIGTIDADTNQALAAHFSVMGLPTIFIFKGGQPVERIVGFTPKKDLKSRIDAHLS